MPQVPTPSQHMHQHPEKSHSPLTLGVSSLDALSADTSRTGTLTLPSKAVKTTTPVPLTLPSILDSSPPTPPLFPLHPPMSRLLRTDSWYVSECFVASGLPTVRIWNRANAGCHSWNPLTCLLSRFVPLTEG